MARTIHYLIIGASRGIGKALAIHLAQQKKSTAHFSLAARDTDKLDQVKRECEAHQSSANVYQLDLTNYSSSCSSIDAIDSQAAIDVAIFSSGITGMAIDSCETEEQIDAIITTNLLSTAKLSTALGEKMAARGNGSLIYLNSIAAFRALPRTPSYCASKAGLKAYTDAIRGKLNPKGVCVQSIHLGFMDTDMTQHFQGPTPNTKPLAKAIPKIAAAIDRKRSLFIYPLGLALGQILLNIFPPKLADAILRKIGYG